MSKVLALGHNYGNRYIFVLTLGPVVAKGLMHMQAFSKHN